MAARLSIAAAVKVANNLHVHNFSYPKSVRLRTRGQFQRVAKSSKRHVGKWIVIDAQVQRQQATRLGITVTKKFGGAVERNRFKRIVREAFRLSRLLLPPGLDLVIKPRTESIHATSIDIQNDLKLLLLPTNL